jgi:hypothetical protein
MSKQTYEVNGNQNRTYASTSKRKAMSVARTWRRLGLCPQVYTIVSAAGRVTCGRIA